jgi:hypothetical protein
VALGVGPFGRDFGWHFAVTVLTPHVAFGVALALLVRGLIREAPLRTGGTNACCRTGTAAA